MDRMYLKIYVPPLQAVEGALKFIRIHHGHQVASTPMVQPITRQFVDSIWAAAERTSALRFAGPQVQALGRAFLRFEMLPVGFSHRELPQPLASRLGQPAQSLWQEEMTSLRRRFDNLIRRLQLGSSTQN
jgi:hypothetical protein